MAQRKEKGFSREDRHLAEMAKALSHPARIAILRKLAKQGNCFCGEIVGVMPLAQSTVSQHLKELRKAGFISGSVDGPKSCYCVNPKPLATFGKSMSGLVEGLCMDATKCC